ncbi:MAG: hypothetical protein AAF798_15265 [Bacteroidota bacterium]
MTSFFNRYHPKEASASLSSITSIPKSENFVAVGRLQDRGLIVRFDASGKLLSQYTYSVPGETCYFSKVWAIDPEHIIVTGSILTKNNLRRDHLVLHIYDQGGMAYARRINNDHTRNLIELTPLNSKEFVISGWDNYGQDRIGIQWMNASNGELLTSMLGTIGGDDQLYDACSFGANQMLFVGGTNKSEGWNGFLLNAHLEKQQALAHILQYPSGKAMVDEIDAIVPESSKGFILGGHSDQDIFITQGVYEGEKLILEPLSFAGLNASCKVRKLLYVKPYVYVLAYDKKTLAHFVARFDLSKSKPHERLDWIKGFEVDFRLYVSDFIYEERSGSFYLSGFQRKEKGGDLPILIKTDRELEGCKTKVIRTEARDPVELIVTQTPAELEKVETENRSIEAIEDRYELEQEALCPDPVGIKPCPLAFLGWNALEPRSRSLNFEQSLRAEVRDAMWMLCRQWQMGEYEGDDAGTIVYSKLGLKTTAINRYTQMVDQPAYQAYHNEEPLEYLAERVAVDIQKDWMLRLEMGNYWVRLLEQQFGSDPSILQTYKQGYLAAYPIVLPSEPQAGDFADPKDFQNAYIAYAQLLSNEENWMVLHAAQHRSIDGAGLYQALQAGISLFQSQELKQLEQAFRAWSAELFLNIDPPTPAWNDSSLEHQFQCQAPGFDNNKKDAYQLKGKEYEGGQLDWYAVDLGVGKPSITDMAGQDFQKEVTKSFTNTLVPAKLSFPGMPNPRWWEMEEQQVDMSNMIINTTDVSKLLLLDFVVNYAGNWYLVPHVADVGSLTEIEGIEVKDNFGIRTLVQASNKVDGVPGGNHRKWSVFQLENESANAAPDSFLLLAPVIPDILESKPIEKVQFIRDEMANMVWGIEQIISDGLNGGQQGHEASLHLQALLKEKEEIPTQNPDYTSKIKYKLFETVPEYFIPFIPVQLPSSARSIQLQRASMPRSIGQFDNAIRPRTQLLSKIPTPYYIQEEEIPKAGRIITSTWHRARWFGGKTLVWQGHKKQVGRGGGTSGLRFDHLTHAVD